MRNAHLFFVALSVVACVSAQGTAQTRAANDFACPEAQVIVTSIGGTSYKAEGCGKSATYTCSASDGNNGKVTAYACIPESAPQPKAAQPGAGH